MTSLLEALNSASVPDRDSYRPEFFRLALPNDRVRLEDLLKHEARVVIHNGLHDQLTELVRSLNPSLRFTKAELDAAAVAHLNGIASEEYGVWVYYPWAFRLVHLLDEVEFALVRTDRNRNKITSEEQAVLATKKVGVIGLSVGQSVSLTMALERSFGEIRLADFDTLELSNLNRIRSGVHEMGTSKVVNTAREIAEIDPWLTVTCFHNGITNENIDRFFTEGGNLDILIEECDNVGIKIIARQKAKALGIPVVMDTSDRGLIDIERFDMEPERPILHGLVDHLDLSQVDKARTNEEKLPFVLPIAGMDTLSPRMKASMLEIENSVTTWPQLASSVVLGGGIGGHMMRRIALGHPVPSGRWWMDPDDIVGVKEEGIPSSPQSPSVELSAIPVRNLTIDEMIAAAEMLGPVVGHRKLKQNEAERLAEAGAHAPSGGNCQPWLFLHHEGRLLLFLNTERALSALDPGLRYAYLGLGACTENMLLSAKKENLPVKYTFRPLANIPQLVAALEIAEEPFSGPIHTTEKSLADQIAVRCTNRKNSETLVLSEEEGDALVNALGSDVPGVHVTLVKDRETIGRIAALCGKAERIRFLNTTCHHDMFVREMRWRKEDVERTKDGIDVATLELSLADRTGLRVAADPKAMSLLRHWGTGKAMEKMASKGILASSALGIISIPDLSLQNAFQGGMGMQRFWLRASTMNILVHPVGAPIFMGIHQLWDSEGILSKEEHREAGGILEELVSILDLKQSKPFFMMRLGMAGDPTARSLRLPLSEIFHANSKSLA